MLVVLAYLAMIPKPIVGASTIHKKIKNPNQLSPMAVLHQSV
jgi:hypothetical protein